MAVSVKCIGIDREDPPGTRIYVRWDDGSTDEYPDFAALQEVGLDIDSGERGQELAKICAIRYWLNRDPRGLDPGRHIIGRSATIDMKRVDTVRMIP